MAHCVRFKLRFVRVDNLATAVLALFHCQLPRFSFAVPKLRLVCVVPLGMYNHVRPCTIHTQAMGEF